MPRTQTAPTTKHVPPPVHRLALSEARNPRPDRGIDHGIQVHYVLPTYYDSAGQDIWFQDSTAAIGDWIYGGRARRPPYVLMHPRIKAGRSYIVSVCPVSALGNSTGPSGATAALIAITGTGYVPSNVSGFDAATDKGDVYFTWTALTGAGSEDVMGYEIRAGATGWLSATHVALAATRERNWIKVPRVKATGTSFYIKAITTTGAVSDAVATATLTAAEATEVDTTSVVGYQDVTVLAGATTVTVTTKATYTAQPFIVCEHKQSGATALGIYKHHVYNFVAGGDNTYSFTLKISDAAPTGGVVITVIEAGAM